MKHIFQIVFPLSVLLLSCTKKEEGRIEEIPYSTDIALEIPNITVDKSVLYYDNKTSLWTLNDQPYSGYSVSFHQDSTLKGKIGIVNGKRENRAIHWYPDGHVSHVANYRNGKLHGEKKVWSSEPGHVLISHLNYSFGKAHGEQKKWYPTGELHQKINLDMGQEKGIQQAFRENGDLYANYEAKNGREFGLKKASLCYGLKEENIQYQK
ncbi:membrane-binding protein [uncultured Arcticibacterium sp.]|uniref:toxin-antitoxin system YwqK family antitoxin n=1 Tax=uncultured Arcticibacterium sp. TaxID=2173042 RepID=UPI0030FB13B9